MFGVTLGSVREGDNLKNVPLMNETGQSRPAQTLHWLTTPQELHAQLVEGLAAHSAQDIQTVRNNRPLTMISRAVSRVTL